MKVLYNFLFYIQKQRDYIHCLVCLLLAMVVDIDHFLAAKSFKLQVRYLSTGWFQECERVQSSLLPLPR